ncbi:hypothetical protein [Nannocystis pusilla]|uniref:hypothetical protein n=1 Tax=Nannocystis pusilla TaxID=889268 RepID=UPI003BF1AC1E
MMTVDDVVQRLRSGGDVGKSWYETYRDPRPLGPAALARLRLPGGSELPAELAAWLAYDAAWLPLLDPSAPLAAPRLNLSPLREILARWLVTPADGASDPADPSGAELLAAWIDLLPERGLVEAPSLELPMSGSQEHVLVLRPGRDPRVLGCDRRYEFWWKYDSFGQFLAHWFGYESMA